MAVVGVGAFGGSTTRDRPVSADGEPSPSIDLEASLDPGPQAPPAGPIDPDLLFVSLPAHDDDEITTRQLTVSGFLRGASASVLVSLEGRRNRVIDSILTFAYPTPGAAESQPTGRFKVAFDLPNPRPNGEMLVNVAVLDVDGQPVDVVWRWVRIGRIVDEAVSPSARTGPPVRTRTLGDDGLMGGIVLPGT